MIAELKKQIAECYAKIAAIQAECNHPKSALKQEYKSNTGNYDPTADCYWIDFHCTLCDKWWSEDQPG